MKKPVSIVCLLAVLTGCGTFSLSPRTNSIFQLQFSDQPPKALIDMTCQGRRSVKEGIAVCEEKSPKVAEAWVKIMPIPGRVIYSDGLKKTQDDFNWRKGGWIWKKNIIDTTWAKLDLGELNSIYGDVPIALDIQGQSDGGIINSRGIIYTRICNDKDIPCSTLVVDYDCAGTIKNTYTGQMGDCARLSGSSQKFRLPLKTPGYELRAGAKIRVQNGDDGWRFSHDVTQEDIDAGEVKFLYPEVRNGPSLFTLTVFQWEQGVLQEYHAYILIVGSSPNWTGIDRPHFYTKGQLEICVPFTSDLMEVSDSNYLTSLTTGCQQWNQPSGQLCAFAFDRESNDMTYACLKDGKEVRFP